MFEDFIYWSTVHAHAFLIAIFLILLYWAKEIMELLLRVVYGVDRRVLYIPVRQNTSVLPFLKDQGVMQHGDLFYYIFHGIISICLGIFGFLAVHWTNTFSDRPEA